MIVCPNKSSREWKDLSKAVGEDVAMLAFIRNGYEVPLTEASARELVTNVGLLKSLESIPTLSEEKIADMLMNQGLALDSAQTIDGRKFYALNPNVEDIGRRLGDISTNYGAILEYRGDYVGVNPQGLSSWNILAQSQNSTNKNATELARSFLTRLGVKIVEQDDVLARYGSNGVADFAERMVLIQSGKMDVALPEEALHFFLDMIPQDTPELVEALDKIRETGLYKATLARYKDNPNYRTKDGQIRFDKIKKEALAKQLAENLKAAPTTLLGKLLQKIYAWIKGTRIQKSPLELLEDMFRSEEIANLNRNMTSDEVYNQLSDERKEFYEAQDMSEEQRNSLNSILAVTQAITFEEGTHTLEFVDPATGERSVLKSATTLLGSDFYSELESPDVISLIVGNYEIEFENVVDPFDSEEVKAKKLIEHIVSKILAGEFEKEEIETVVGPKVSEMLFQSAENRKKTLFGTAIHNIVEAIVLDQDIDFDNPDIVDPIIYNFMDKETLRTLVYGTPRKPGIMKIISGLIDSGHVLMTEVEIGNKKVGGVADIIAIDKDGVAHIFDFKTKFLREGFKTFDEIEDEFDYVTSIPSLGGVKPGESVLPEVQGKRRSLKEKYAQQLSIYKKILMQAGIRVGDTTIIAVAYKLDKDGKVTKIKPFLTKPLPFNDKIASGYFAELDMSNDATKKTEKSAEDERTKLLDSISKPKLKESFAKMLARLEQLYSYFSKNKDARFVYEAFNEDGTNTVKETRDAVRNFLENFGEDGDLTNLLALQKQFIDVIESGGPIIAKMSEKFEALKKTTSPDQTALAQKLNELYKIKEFVLAYRNMYQEMLGYMGTTNPDNLLVKRLNEMVGAIDNIQNSYIQTVLPYVSSMLGSEFTDELVDNMKREINEMIASAKARGDKNKVKELEKFLKDLPSENVIMETLRGLRGDIGNVLSKILPTISIPDVVVAGVGKRLKRVLDVVRLKMKDFRDGLSVEFDKRTQVYGKGPKLSMKAMNESLVYEAEVFEGVDEEGKDKKRFQLTFKSEFLEQLYYDYDKLVYAYREAVKTGDKQKISDTRKKMKDFEQEFFESDYTDEYYKLTRPLDAVVTYGNTRQTIREIINGIIGDIKAIEAQYDKDALAEGKMTEQHMKDRQELWESYYELMQLKNPDGTDKTGDALVIAKSMIAYQNNKRLLYDDIELTGLFEKMKTKVMLKYGEQSDEYQKWLANNTRLVISDRYYEEMDALMKELASLSTNPNADRISELYQELRSITQPFKDKDGFINGTFMKPETVQKIKDIQEEIDELQNQVEEYTVDGYTAEEKQIRKEQFYLRDNNPEDYNRFIIAKIDAKKDDRLDNDPDLKARVNRAKEIKQQLASMRTVQFTKYYYEELEKQERMFAEAAGVTYEELKVDNDLYQQFRESSWFRDNHTYSKRVVFDSEFGESVTSENYIPVYIWRRNVPTKDYIEQKPARHFTKRVLKESYINDRGEEVRLMNKDNRDVLNRFKPKSNQKYKQQYGKDHKYLNKDYASLKEKYNNKTASPKERVDYENLVYLQNEMLKAQENIEPRYRIGLAVPFAEKDFMDRFVETKGQNVKTTVQDVFRGMQRSLTKTEASADEGFADELARSDRDMAKLGTIDNYEVKYVPVRYTSKGAASDNSYDVWGSVLNYVGSTIRKKELDQELALINTVKEILGDTENQPKSETKNTILNNIFKTYIPQLEAKLNKGTNTRLEILQSFVNSVMYNEEHFEGYDIAGINTHKLIDKAMSLGSITMLGLAPFNWAVNWLSGQVQNTIEAAGGKYYSFKTYQQAKKEIYRSTKYGYVMKDMMSDYSKVGKKSFWGQVMEVFDPIQGEFENEYGQKTSWNKFNNILRAGIFAGKIWGEWEIQMSSFIAFMKNVRLYNGKMYDKDSFITMKIGVDLTGLTPKQIREKKLEAIREFDKLETNLLDILELNKDGKLSVKAQYQQTFQLGDKQFSDLVGKLHSMQKRINGAYAKFDTAYAAKSSMGRLMFFFRKYFVQLGMNRFGYMRPDYEGMTIEEGFYITFAKTAIKDLLKLRWNIVKNWNNYSDFERAAIAKTLTELGIILTLWALYGLLLGYDDDDKDRMKKLKRESWATQAMIFTLLKVRSETEQFLPYAGVDEIMKIYSNPSILFGTLSNFIVMFGHMFGHIGEMVGVYDGESLYYKRDSGESPLKEKGDSKLFANFMKTFFGYTGKTFHPIDAIKGFEFAEDMYMRR